MATRKAGELYVHELCLAAADLEQRYRQKEVRGAAGGRAGLGQGAPAACAPRCQAGAEAEAVPAPRAQDVYVEEMVHRNPGDASTLAPMEQPFSVTRAWVAGEAEQTGAAGAASSGFTRVVIGDLKPDVLRQIMKDGEGARAAQAGRGAAAAVVGQPPPPSGGGSCMKTSWRVLRGRVPNSAEAPPLPCRSWPTSTTTTCTASAATAAGRAGRRARGGCPTATPCRTSPCRWAACLCAPAVQVCGWLAPLTAHAPPRAYPGPQYQVDSSVVWSKHLAQVDDDMETRMLRAHRAELPFTLQVPDKVRRLPWQGGRQLPSLRGNLQQATCSRPERGLRAEAP